MSKKMTEIVESVVANTQDDFEEMNSIEEAKVTDSEDEEVDCDDEDKDEINELSAEKLGAYASKAYAKGNAQHGLAGTYGRMAKKREDDHEQHRYFAGRAKIAQKKADKRDMGYDLARDKVNGDARVNANEDVEQIDELSKNTVKAYREKAREDQADHMYTAGRNHEKAWTNHEIADKTKLDSVKKARSKDAENAFDDRDKSLAAVRRRNRGITLANKKIENDDVRVPSKNPVGRPRKVTSEDFNIAEDIKAIFASENLSEDFIEKASRIYEASIVAKATEVVNNAVAQIEEDFEDAINLHVEELEEYAASLDEEFEDRMDEMVENIDRYLDKVISEWKEENEVALRQTAQAQIAESFMGKLKDLFLEHYIDIPENEVDLVEAQAEEMEALENDLNEEIQKNVELRDELAEAYKALVVTEVSNGLTEGQKIKLASLAENVSFSDIETYKGKVEELKESYFTRKPTVTKVDENTVPVEIITEEVKTKVMNPLDKYLGKI